MLLEIFLSMEINFETVNATRQRHQLSSYIPSWVLWKPLTATLWRTHLTPYVNQFLSLRLTKASVLSLSIFLVICRIWKSLVKAPILTIWDGENAHLPIIFLLYTGGFTKLTWCPFSLILLYGCEKCTPYLLVKALHILFFFSTPLSHYTSI